MNLEHCELKACPHGSMVVTTRNFAPGETLLSVYGSHVSQRTTYTVQIARHCHLDPEGALWGFVNHGCHANATIDLQRGCLIALDSITAGEEICWNYLLTEEELHNPFECHCRHSDCVGIIRGYRFLDADQRNLLESQRQPPSTPRHASL